MISVRHGRAFYERCPNVVEPMWIEGGGHDFEFDRKFQARLWRFLYREVDEKVSEESRFAGVV